MDDDYMSREERDQARRRGCYGAMIYVVALVVLIAAAVGAWARG